MGSTVMWYVETLTDQIECLNLEMRRALRHQAIWDAESRTLINDGRGGISARFWKREKPPVV